MNVLTDALALLQPQADAAAASAANAALDSVAARPFSVVISVDRPTKEWLTLLLVGLLVGGVVLKRAK